MVNLGDAMVNFFLSSRSNFSAFLNLIAWDLIHSLLLTPTSFVPSKGGITSLPSNLAK